MKTQKLALVVPMLLLASCHRNLKDDAVDSPAIPLPPFEIQITLSDSAKQKLAGAGETIKGNIHFDGDGLALPGDNRGPSRAVFLGNYEFEIQRPGAIRITNATISAKAYSRLSETNWHLTINVASGRRAFTNNVLDGGFSVGRFLDLNEHKPIIISCDLF